MKYTKMREEELKNRVGADFFEKFNCTRIVGSIDFAVKFKRSNNALDFNDEYLLWAEAKVKPDGIPEMLTQLVLTIGKARTFDKIPPPPFLGCFDNAKIAFVRYANFHNIFSNSDINWKVAPSNRETKEFKLVEAYIRKIIDESARHDVYIFDFEKDVKELTQFIRENFIFGKIETTKICIDKNNFISVYNKWLDVVKPSIWGVNWEMAKTSGIIDGDFYLADLLSDENKTLKDKLFVLLKSDHYVLSTGVSNFGMNSFMETGFNDEQKAHTQFWAKYKRPPLEEYWDYIVERRDLLVPQDVRERKGSFFTPKIWVELSQKYIADVLGEDWQDEYYVWDCAAGTGNLLAGLVNKYNIWASTLDKADVDVMKDRIKNGAVLLEDHVFQFDFLNDNFTKLPKGLQDIINDEKKRKKLIIYINPPYAEADNRKGEGRAGVAKSVIHIKYSNLMGYTKRELYIQFLTRIYCEIPACIIADFSTLKHLQAPRFQVFRQLFRALLKKIFLVPANTFDNVDGDFPIGFQIWDTSIKADFEYISADVYDEDKNFIGSKILWTYDNVKLINNWVKTYRTSNSKSIATIIGVGSDFQNQRLVRFGEPHMKVPADNHNWQITKDNLIESCIYFTVRKIIPADWLNDRDQFLYPNDDWQVDREFQNDCFAYTLFSNNMSSSFGKNNWIPFTESEVNSRDNFSSSFMTDFMAGKLKSERTKVEQLSMSLVKKQKQRTTALKFSPEAKAVFKAGKALWQYYHAQPDCNVNASLYDIREYFQGRNDNGKMNNKSDDKKYSGLIGDLRSALKVLGEKIVPTLYEYGFLRE